MPAALSPAMVRITGRVWVSWLVQVARLMSMSFSGVTPCPPARRQGAALAHVSGLDAHEVVAAHRAAGGDKTVRLAQPASLEGIAHAARVGEPGHGHARGQQLPEGGDRVRREVVVLAGQHPLPAISINSSAV